MLKENLTLYQKIKINVEELLDDGITKFILFPYGEIGEIVRTVMNNSYGIDHIVICDNHLSVYNKSIHTIDVINEIDCDDFGFIYTCKEASIYDDYSHIIEKKINSENIKFIFERIEEECITKIGRHSYGPIVKNHRLIKSIGSFCSFAEGVDVVANHSLKFLTTSPIIDGGQGYEVLNHDYDLLNGEAWYVEGIHPKNVNKHKRIEIGNDVWLGRNVTIANYSNIGNGVVAGAGAVITRDVPDYAIVMGVPARIVRYRYSPDIISALNTIKWWDWTDEEIRDRFDDFYIDIEEFVRKYQ